MSLSAWSICTSSTSGASGARSSCTNGNTDCASSSATVAGWIVATGTFCPINSVNSFYNSCGSTDVYGYIQQTLTLAVGVRYLLSFDVKAHASGQTSRTTFVGIDGETFFAMANNVVGSSTATKTVVFTATSTNQVLFFSASGDRGGAGNCKFFFCCRSSFSFCNLFYYSFMYEQYRGYRDSFRSNESTVHFAHRPAEPSTD